MSNQTEQTQANNFINLTTQGIGYLSRVRAVMPKRSKEEFLACTINAMHGNKGEKDGIQYVKFDVRVSGSKAIEVIGDFAEAINQANVDKIPVLISFNIGDYYIDSFKYTQGEKAGQTGNVLKGRLLKVKFIKIGQDTVYTEPVADVETEAQGESTRQAA